MEDLEDVVMFMIPVVAIVFGVGAGMLVVWANHRRRQQLLAQWHTERMAAMEKGLPLPELAPSLLGDADTSNAMLSLRRGLSLLLIGIIVYVATARAIDEDLALFGLIPSAVGIANLIHAGLLWRRKQAHAPSDNH